MADFYSQNAERLKRDLEKRGIAVDASMGEILRDADRWFLDLGEKTQEALVVEMRKSASIILG